MESIEGGRYVVVYSDHESVREVYSQHAKRQIEKNEAVILLLYYDTPDRARPTLLHAGIDVTTHEGGGFLVIMDSYAVFLGFKQDNDLYFNRLVPHAIVSGKAGICIIADMGAFFLMDRLAQIAAGWIKVRGFYTYHKKDFEKLSEGQRKAIFGRDYRALFLQQAS